MQKKKEETKCKFFVAVVLLVQYKSAYELPQSILRYSFKKLTSLQNVFLTYYTKIDALVAFLCASCGVEEVGGRSGGMRVT